MDMNHLILAHGGDISEPAGGTDRIRSFTNAIQEVVSISLVVPKPKRALPDFARDLDVITVSTPSEGTLDQPLRAAAIVRKAKSVRREYGGEIQFEHSTLGGVGSLFGTSNYILDMHDLEYTSPQYQDLGPTGSVANVVKFIEGRAIKNAKHIICVSESMKEMLIDEWDITSGEISVVPNGYSRELINSVPNRRSKQARVVFMGTFHSKVDFEGLKSVCRQDAVEELVVIGGGGEGAGILDELDEVRRSKITFTGWLPPQFAYEVVKTADVAIAPYRQSSALRASSPVKLYTYAALGMPIVTSLGSDFAEDLVESGAAIGVKPDEDFGRRVRQLMNDRKKKETIKHNALAVAERNSWEERELDIKPIYKNI